MDWKKVPDVVDRAIPVSVRQTIVTSLGAALAETWRRQQPIKPNHSGGREPQLAKLKE